MINSDKRRFLEMMTGVGEMYGKKISTELLTMYFGALQKYSIDDVYNGLNLHAVDPNHGTFFPKPADIVRNIEKGNQPALDDAQRAEMAWTIVYDKIANVGPYKKLQMEDKLAIASVKAIGGWQKLCNSTVDELVWLKKEFVMNYGIYSSTELELLPNELAGIFEIEQDKKQTTKTVNNLLSEAQKRLGDES